MCRVTQDLPHGGVKRPHGIFGKIIASPTDDEIGSNEHTTGFVNFRKLAPGAVEILIFQIGSDTGYQDFDAHLLRDNARSLTPDFAAMPRDQREALFSGKVERGHGRSGCPMS